MLKTVKFQLKKFYFRKIQFKNGFYVPVDNIKNFQEKKTFEKNIDFSSKKLGPKKNLLALKEQFKTLILC